MIQKNFLPLMEAYYTIQGEGFHTGCPAYFIRLGGCDVGCHWCDTKDSWDETKFPAVSAKDIASLAASTTAKIVVITGGEPLMHDLTHLTEELKKIGKQPHLETSGAYPLTGEWSWICLSPKKTMPPVGEIHHFADELKMIIYNKNDFLWAEEYAGKVKQECKMFLQPEWNRVNSMVPQITEYVKINPKWRISLQTHKYLNIR